MSRPKVLYLTQRIPFPPDKGDKIATFNILKYLSARADVYLGTFIDDEYDERYVSELDKYCKEVFIARVSRLKGGFRSAVGILAGKSFSEPYFFDSTLQDWCNKVIAKNQISRAFLYCSIMSQYISSEFAEENLVLAHYTDIDSDKWRQYALMSKGIKKKIYQREAKKLLEFEIKNAQRFTKTTFVTQTEVDLFNQLSPTTAAKVGLLENGTDTKYWSPQANLPASDGSKESRAGIVFAGVMDYFPNIDAVSWFAKEVFPSIRKEIPTATFTIVGSKPTTQVKALESFDGVKVTGRVSDVRPFLEAASVSVAPLRAARGIQNKVLEAMAMGLPVVCTSSVAKPLKPLLLSQVLIADDATEFCSAVLAAIRLHKKLHFGSTYRQTILGEYSWDSSLASIKLVLQIDTDCKNSGHVKNGLN